MHVSFIIPAHNEAPLIGGTIDAIRAAAANSLSRFEVIVVDDASDDGTAERAGASGALVVRHERRQIAATRNLGARASRGKGLVFVDADTRITPDLLREALERLEQGCVGGGALADFEGAVPRHARVLLAVLRLLFRISGQCGGAFVFCTRAAYDATGWDESVYAGEEILFIRALKRQGRFRLVKSRVVTSGRKLRTHSAREIYGFFLRAAFAGRRLVEDRSRLDIWYGPRRPDPGA